MLAAVRGRAAALLPRVQRRAFGIAPARRGLGRRRVPGWAAGASRS